MVKAKNTWIGLPNRHLEEVVFFLSISYTVFAISSITIAMIDKVFLA